jgi:hypothetical protein
MTNRMNAARTIWNTPTVIPDIDPPFHVAMSPALTGAMSSLTTVHRAAVLMKIERIAELASWGELRGPGRFTVDSVDLLESIHLEFEVDASAQRVAFGHVEDPRF